MLVLLVELEIYDIARADCFFRATFPLYPTQPGDDN